MIINKDWGYEDIIINEPEYCLKRLCIFAGRKSSLHYHEKKKETFLVVSGIVRLEQVDIRGALIDEMLEPTALRTLMPGTPHRFSSLENSLILEVSTHHSDEDVIRLEPSGYLNKQIENQSVGEPHAR